mmetsp:Transcript_143943/g.358889  ORF Transcript_143943/g.358889 Transcript_143943/m.358889 type:complete len:324 (-) Transcript_143943:1095-2066(-)
MGEQEGVGPANLVVVSEFATDHLQVGCVMVLDESDAADWVTSHDARQPATAIEAREIVRMDGVLQRVINREVVHSCDTLGGVDVIPQDLHIPVPILSDGVRCPNRTHVLLLEPSTIAQNKIEADRPEANVLHEPLHVCLRIFLDLLIGVVDVRRVLDVLARGLGAPAVARGIVPADSPTLPIWVLERGPLPLAVLLRGTPVVDDDVCHRGDPRAVQLGDQLPQLLVAAILRVQVVPLPRQVAAVVDTLRRRRQPQHVDASLLQLRNAALHDIIPTILVVTTVPIEGLQKDVRLCVAHARRFEHGLCLAHGAFTPRPLILTFVD